MPNFNSDSLTHNTSNMQIKVSKDVINYVCQQAKLGYETPYKEERIGFLFGEKINNDIRITDAKAYKGGIKKRSVIEYDVADFIKRAKTLANQTDNFWIGTYHTHVEEGGEISRGLSDDDKDSFRDEPILVELLITVCATDNPRKLNPGSKSLLHIQNFGDTYYRYVISAYVKTPKGLRQIEITEI